MEWCLKLIEISDEFWMFGVSNGTLEELVHAKKIIKPVKLFLDDFDYEWRKHYQDLKDKHGSPLDNSCNLITFK